ncbi:hypothetical protein D3C80_1571410 [compost metagenome]
MNNSKSLIKEAQSNIRQSLIAELKEITSKIGPGSKKLDKEIEKGSKKLAKKLSKELKFETSSPVNTQEPKTSTKTADVKPVKTSEKIVKKAVAPKPKTTTAKPKKVSKEPKA